MSEAILSVIVLYFLHGFIAERRLWNGGVCRRCDTAWSHFDTDSQGGRGYRCACRGEWITHSVDVRRST